MTKEQIDEVARNAPVVRRHHALSVPEHPILAADRFVSRQNVWLHLGVLCSFLAPLLLTLAVLSWLEPTGKGLNAFLISTIGIVGSMRIGVMTHSAAQYWAARKMKSVVWKDVQNRHGSVSSTATYVGVAFSDEVWYVNSESSWDFGALQIENTKIRFLGRKLGFELEGSRITSVDIKRHGRHFRVYVRWRGPDEASETLSIEPREPRNVRDLLAACVDIRDTLNGMRSASGGSEFAGELPPLSSTMPLREPEHAVASRKAKMYGFVFVTCLMATTMVLIELLCLLIAKRHSSVSGACFVPVYIFGYPLAVTWFERMLRQSEQQSR